MDKLISDNEINYNGVTAVIDDTNYVITGRGVCYANIDKDTVIVKNLEVV